MEQNCVNVEKSSEGSRLMTGKRDWREWKIKWNFVIFLINVIIFLFEKEFGGERCEQNCG